MCCVSDSVCECEFIRNMFRRGCYFVGECYGIGVGGGAVALLHIPCMVFQRVCVLSL